jgi:iron complex outermembrane receptor protein
MSSTALALTLHWTPLAAQEADKRFDININPTTVAEGLKGLQSATGISLFFMPEQVRELHTRGVSGQLTVEEAFKYLLAGTGLRVRTNGEGTYVIAEARESTVNPEIPVVRIAAAGGANSPQRQAAPAPQEAAAPLEEIVVSGTRIVRDGYAAPTPTSVLGVAEIESAAPANVADFVNQLPSIVGSSTPRSQISGVSGATTGINALALRNLSATRTLVLLDGQRVPASHLTGLVDVNEFPQALISRVDVVTGGASAAWGSDAVAGVVNFILDKKYTGLKGEIQGGVSTYGDDRSYKISLTGGTGFANDRGHALLSVEDSHVDGIVGVPRPWYSGIKTIVNPAYTPTNGQPQLLVRSGAGFSNAAPGAIISAGPLKGIYFGPGGAPAQLNYGSLVNDPFIVGGDWQYTDFGTLGDMDPRISHQSVFARMSYDLSDNVEVFVQASYGISKTFEFETPQFNLGNLTIQRDNAFLPPQITAQMTALGIASVRVGSTNADLGPVIGTTKRETYRYVIGASGRFEAFDSAWSWDVYGQEGRGLIYNAAVTSNTANYNRAIDAVRGTNGQIVCRSTLTNPNDGCVPYNLLGTGVASAAAKNYVLGLAWLKNNILQKVEAGSIHGEPFSNWAGPVSLAAGIEHRQESTRGSNDPGSTTNSYFVGNYHASAGSYNVTEGFLETVVPIAKNVVWAKTLDLNAAVRATDYSTSGYVTTWKIGATYNPIDDITIRATRSRDIRAPNLSEEFAAGQASTNTLLDPFRNNFNTTYVSLTSGNTALKPEKADTTGIGVVLQPRFFPGFSASIDYYNIDIADAISTISAVNIVNNCFAGNTTFCGQIIRDSSGAISRILVQPINLLSLAARGVDFESSYSAHLDGIVDSWSGDIGIRFLATHYLKNYSSNGINVPTDTAGQNAQFSGPPSWRYMTSLSYTEGPLRMSLTARAISSGVYSNAYIQCTSACPTSTVTNMTIDNNHIAGSLWLDAAFNYKFTEILEGFLTIENLANRAPVQVAGSTSVGLAPIGVNPSLYDVVGRSFRMGARFKM